MENWEMKEDQKYSLLYKDGYPDGNPARVALWAGLKKSDKVIDLGCGLGVLSNMFEDYTGIDVSKYVIERNKITFPDKTFVSCGLTELEQFPFSVDKYDVGICADVIEHIPPNYVEEVIRSISELHCDKFIFSVSTRASKILAKDGSNLHLTVMGYDEWVPLFERYFTMNYDKMFKNEQSFFLELYKKK